MRLPYVLLNLTLNWNPTDSLSNSYQHCKPLPSSPHWPSPEQWQALNESVAGRLHAPIPAGLVCHAGQPGYTNSSCSIARDQWVQASWHASSPWSVDYNDDTCLPDPSAPCSSAGYPAYVVEALAASDVQAAVNFARRTGVRLVVKGTGHDWPGRSSGPGALSIWTHRIRGINVTYHDPRAVAYGGVASVKIAAGMQWKEIYDQASAHNLTIVGGGDTDVGIGGWVLGGGHSPISSRFGLGADQVLELEVVTADGQHRIVNEHAYPDLFWALRGGGGSTYAVLLSVTMKAYPRMPTALYQFSYNSTADSDTFWSMIAYFHQQLPGLSDSGAMGYYFIEPMVSAAVGTLYGAWFFPEKTADQARAIVSPMEKFILSSPSWAQDPIVGGGLAYEVDDFLTAFKDSQPQSVGIDGRLGSWLLDKEALSKPLEILKTQLQKSTPAPWMLLGHVVAGKGVRHANIPGGSNSVSPHLRNAYSHVVIPRTWQYLNATDKAVVTTSLRDEANPALRELAPTSGAYMNEADPTIANWQEAFYGRYYPRLLELKKKWDPEGVFWCKPCVGHELWEITGPSSEDRADWGVGQIGGRLCRK